MVITRSGYPLSRWGSGLQVMKKNARVDLGNKLQAIVLVEADCNFNNKWAFGHMALNSLYKSGCVPEEQYN